MKKFELITGYLKYYISSKTRFDIHSPFVFDFVNKVLRNKKTYSALSKIEKFRKKASKNDTAVTIHEMGGNQHGKYKSTIGAIVTKSAKQKKYCRLLFLMARHFKPKTMVELGTSFGISAMAQAVAVPDSQLITLEGNTFIATVAEQFFKEEKISNIKVAQGNFDDRLPAVLSELDTVDWFFIDGNHRKAPLLKYFEIALKKSNQNTVLIIDDIRWSEEMKDAWETIKKHAEVTISIDLYMMGIVFINKDFSKQDFVIRY